MVTLPSGGTRRRFLAFIAALLVAAAAFAFIELGTFLAKEDQLQRADAIFVLAGTEITRPLEGADLYFAHYAPIVVMTRETPERAVAALRGRGPLLAPDVERARDALIELGVPRDALIVPDRIHNSTAAEAITLRELAQRNGWRRVIVVTSRLHLRRAGFAIRRELRGTGTEVTMHGSRYDDAMPERWWTSRGDIREMISEVPKLIVYVLGLGA